VNVRVAKVLNVTLGPRKLGEITADEIELFLRIRLRQRTRFKTSKGYREKGVVKPSTVHQEFRVLRRVLNVAVRKRLLPSNPCCGVEFPVAVKGMFRPHYVPWSEQQRTESNAPAYLCNAIRIVTETGMRIYKELICMKRDQLDLNNAVVWISDSKTPSGEAEVPLTELALDAFRQQLAICGAGQYLFPSVVNDRGHQKSFKTARRATLRRANAPYFRIYDLRSACATRREEWRTNGSRNCSGRSMPKCSRNTHR
jgi:integrase